MLLAEALSLRADTLRRVARLRARIVSNARYQEGETPAEDANGMLVEVGTVLDELESLMARINRTNAAAPFDDATLTDAIARRDVLRQRHDVLTVAADAAAGSGHYARQLRSELKQLSALPVADLRRSADDTARQIRELDIRIQRTNWEVELID